MAGLEVLRSLKAHSLGPWIPVVALAYARDAADLQSAYALGANSCVVKPAEFDQYVEMVARLDHYWGVLNLTPVPASADA